MQKQKENLSASTAKLIMFVSLIAGIGAIIGVLGYYLTKQTDINLPIITPTTKTISAIEISKDRKSILNAETKEVIFTIDDANKYLKDSGYAYNPDIFQTTNAKYAGDCFRDIALSNNKDRIVFSTGCLEGDLPQAWIGVYSISAICANTIYGNGCPRITMIEFLIGGSGRNFTWSEDDKTITYEADLGLSGFVETRKIDANSGEILKKENFHASEFFNEQRGMIKINGDEYFGYTYLKDDNIYYGGKIRGFIKNDIINIYINDQILSFRGDLGKVAFGPIEGMDYNFYYNNLEISNTFRGPYAIYRKVDMDKIRYKCDGSLLVTSDGEQLPNYYCETNGKDFLSQYEYSAANGNGFSTGASFSLYWYKLYIKNINGINYAIHGVIKGGSLDVEDKNYLENYKNLSSRKYLNEILADEENIKKIKEWDEFVKNITFTEKDETADWKTYKNEEYGFEFKYPKDWAVENFGAYEMTLFKSLVAVGLNKADYKRLPDTDMPNSANFYLYKSIADLDSEKISIISLKDYLDKYSTLSDPVYKNVINKKIGSLDGYEADAGPNQFGGGKYYFTELPNKQIISFWLFNERIDQKVMNQILSTFKFIEK